MSSHLITLAIGLTIGSGVTYTAIVLWANRHRATPGKAAEVLELACPPLEVVRLSDLPGAEQPVLFPVSILRDRARPINFTPISCPGEDHYMGPIGCPDTPASLFLRSAETQPASE